MKEANILSAYAYAKERYAALGVDTDKAIAELEKQQISLHCWQTDDVGGFESNDALSGGIQATGNYPGRARNIDEVRADLEFVKTLLAGNHRVNLHEIYGDFDGKFVDRDQVGVEHFQSWIEWAKANNFKLDFNSTSSSGPRVTQEAEVGRRVVSASVKLVMCSNCIFQYSSGLWVIMYIL